VHQVGNIYIVSEEFIPKLRE